MQNINYGQKTQGYWSRWRGQALGKKSSLGDKYEHMQKNWELEI